MPRYIDADALKEAIENLCNANTDYWNAPTIDPDRPHGEWKQITEPDIWGKIKYQCSVCKHVHRHSEFDTISFCENCGAKMKEGDEK